MTSPDRTTPHVVIIGGGFAGLWATRALEGAPVRITLVDRRNHHLFQPLLYQVATAGLSAPDIAAPLRHILRRQRNVEVRLAEVRGDRTPTRSRCRLDDGSALDFDYLLLASGATHAYFGHDEWAAHAPGLKTLDDALAICAAACCSRSSAPKRESDPEERAAWLSFAIVGGGPTGVELAGTLAEIARHTLAQRIPQHRSIAKRACACSRPGRACWPRFPNACRAARAGNSKRSASKSSTGTPVTAIDGEGYRFGDTFVPARTVLWAAGVAASPLARIARRTARSRRARAGRAGPERAGHIRRSSSPAISPRCSRTANRCPASHRRRNRWAATSHTRSAHVSRASPRRAFRYRDYGNLATIGRMAAVVAFRHGCNCRAWSRGGSG